MARRRRTTWNSLLFYLKEGEAVIFINVVKSILCRRVGLAGKVFFTWRSVRSTLMPLTTRARAFEFSKP